MTQDMTDTSVFDGIIEWTEGGEHYRGEAQGGGHYHIRHLTDDSWLMIGHVIIRGAGTPQKLRSAMDCWD